MLESVTDVPQFQTPVIQQTQLWNIPTWTLKKVEHIFSNITGKIKKKLNIKDRTLTNRRTSVNSTIREQSETQQALSEWTFNSSRRKCTTSSMHLEQNDFDQKKVLSFCSKTKNPLFLKDDAKFSTKFRTLRKVLSKNRKLKMTRKAHLRMKERIEIPQKSNGYCKICRTSYSVLSDHERTLTHINFTKNCSNFLSLDSLINEGIDVESFLKMNKSNLPNTCLERRSLRNIIKLHQDSDSQNLQKQLQVICNGNSDSICKEVSPRENKRNNLNEQSVLQSPFSPPISTNGHYLRSKSNTVGDNDKISPKELRREILRNGSVSPRINLDKNDNSSKINGRIEDKETTKYSDLFKNRKPRSIRWRRPNAGCNSSASDNQTYYKVVGMSTKLRSSNNFHSVHKGIEPVQPPSRHCNGETDTGLVVKFRRVRRSELSVLSDEAENFMFPKKDDGETTEEEADACHFMEISSNDISVSSNTNMNCNIKEEVLSGDDISQDSYNSDCVRRRGRRRMKNASYCYKVEPSENKGRQNSTSDSVSVPNKNDEVPKENNVVAVEQTNPQSPDKCLRWENGRLKVSPEVENLVYTFEQVPVYEPWYETFRRQDEGKENSKSIAHYLGYYWKSPILPYEMGYLPPLKPNCCALSQIKKPVEIKAGPARLYGTRGMKKKKNKSEGVHIGKNPRKSPREHASTLAILGSLIHKKKNKLSNSDDSKSLPSITEEDISNDMPLLIKMPEIPASEETKKLEDFFSNLYDDSEDYDSFIDNLDLNVELEKNNKPNVLDLLENYQQCDSIEKSAKEIQDHVQQRNENQRKRRGHKFKKKNKTGWPAKKRIHVKKETTSVVESAESSRDDSVNRNENDVNDEKQNNVESEETQTVIDNSSENTDSAEKTKIQNVNVENNDSITSCSDVDDKISNSSKCKLALDADLSNSEDENFTSNVDLNSKHSGSVECALSERTNNEEDKSHHSNHNKMEMQPVVRVQKIDAKPLTTRGIRKLRSSGPKRKLRHHLHR